MTELERSQNLKIPISRWKINQKYIKVTEYLLKKVNEQKQSPAWDGKNINARIN